MSLTILKQNTAALPVSLGIYARLFHAHFSPLSIKMMMLSGC